MLCVREWESSESTFAAISHFTERGRSNIGSTLEYWRYRLKKITLLLRYVVKYKMRDESLSFMYNTASQFDTEKSFRR